MIDKKPISWLRDNIGKRNLVDFLSDDVLSKLGTDVVYGYDVDKASRSKWEKVTEDGLKLAMQETQEKSDPWPGCANVKHPLVAIASIQFAARAYPEIVKGTDVVKARIVGDDPDGKKEERAKRVSQHMSWQLTEQMPEWDEDTDKLLHALPVVGMCYRKTYRDPILGRNKSEFRSALHVVVNNGVRDLETCRRITDEVYLYKNEVIERERAGIFIDKISDLFEGDPQEKPQDLFLEQHFWADLDGDGYEEPYVVTVHHATAKVARIVANYDEEGITESSQRRNEVARIEPVSYFTKFAFIPSPDGSFHDIGFAQLLGPLNEVMNTLVNQLLDAGSLANQQCGFVAKGIRWQGGKMVFKRGEWKQVDVSGGTLKDNVVPLPIKEPSTVLFQLLGWLNDAANRLASVSETMTGDTPGQNVPATTVLAMIEQGLKVFTAVYKRVYRGLKKEYAKLYRLNRMHMNQTEYFRVLDSQSAVYKADYDAMGLDIVPVADPTISSEAQRLARARAELETIERNPSLAGRAEILRRYYEALQTPNVDKILPPEEIKQITEAKPPPNPALIKLEADMLKAKSDAELAMAKFELEREKAFSEIELAKSNAILAIAKAEALELGQQFEQYKQQVDTLANQVKLAIAAKEADTRAKAAGTAGKASPGSDAEPDAGAGGGMEERPDDAGGVPIPAAGAGGAEGADGLGPDSGPLLSGPDSAGDGAALGGDMRPGMAPGDQGAGE